MPYLQYPFSEIALKSRIIVVLQSTTRDKMIERRRVTSRALWASFNHVSGYVSV